MLGGILLYSFYLFVESQKQKILSTPPKSISQVSIGSQDIVGEPVVKPVLDTPKKIVKPRVKVMRKHLRIKVAKKVHRENMAKFKKESSRIYYSDDKIVEYKVKMEKQQQVDEQNLQAEFNNLFSGKN